MKQFNSNSNKTMTTGMINNVEAPVKTKKRRGINNETKAVAQLKFHEKDAATNGLFIGHLEDVKVEYSTNEDNKDFPGLALPRLTFHFASNHINVNERRHVYRTLFPIVSNVDTVIGGKEEWKVNNVFNWIKHIMDVFYLKGRELTEQEEDLLTLSFEDTDDNGDYVFVEPEEVVKAYGELFKNAANMLNDNLPNGKGKPCYKTADGKFINCWMKLLRYRRTKTGNWMSVGVNGDLSFDTFIGSGAIELYKQDALPSILRLDLSRESITPKETKKAPTVGIPVIPNMDGTIAVDPFASQFNNDAAITATGVESPF